MRVIDVEQLSPAWFEARKGRPSASNFHRILTPTGKLAAAADEYICELVAERLCLVPAAERPMNGAMRHGVEYEDEARRWLEFELGVEIQRVGLLESDCGRFLASPDGLVFGPGGEAVAGVEIKAPQGKTHVRWLLDDCLPAEHAAQVAGSLIVSGLPRWHFLSYAPGLPPLHVVVTPDAYCDKLRAALEAFDGRLQEALLKFVPQPAEAA